MSVAVEPDEKIGAKIDAVVKDSDKNHLQYINKTLEKSLQRDLARKGKLSEEEVRKMYKEAYEKFPDAT